MEYFKEYDGPQSIDNGKVLGRQYHKGPKTPKAPDYQALATQQAAIDKAAANDALIANRPNQVNDTGSTTWSQANPATAGSFDQAGYDKAMAAYQAQQLRGGTSGYNGVGNAYNQNSFGFSPYGGVNTGGSANGSGGGLVAPNRADYEIAGTPASGAWTQTTHLNDRLLPGLEAQQRTQTGLAQGAENLYGSALDSISQPMDTSGLPAWGDPSFQSTKDVQDATYALMAPELLRQRKAAENQLITQGVGRGANEAWSQGQRVLGQNENDAILKSILAGTTEANNVFNRQNTAHTNSYNQAVADRGRPMTELSGLMGLTDGAFAQPVFNSFGTSAGAPGAQVAQAGQQGYTAAMNAANAQNQSSNNFMSGLMGIGGQALGSYIGTLGGPAGTVAGGAAGGAIGNTFGTMFA
jgi:hypothetical protein